MRGWSRDGGETITVMKATIDVTVATFVDGREVEVVCTAGEAIDLPAGAAGDALVRILDAASSPTPDPQPEPAPESDAATSTPTRRRK